MGLGPRDWGSPRRRGERHKGCTLSGSRSPWPNFKRGACAPGEPSRCAENPGVPAEPGLGASAGGVFLDSWTPGRDPGASRRRRREASRGRGPRCPQKFRALPRMPLALAGRPRSRPSGPYGAPSSPVVFPAPGQGGLWHLLPPPSSFSLSSFSPLLPSSEPNRGARQTFLLLHLLLLPGGSAEEGSPEGGMWVSL